MRNIPLLLVALFSTGAVAANKENSNAIQLYDLRVEHLRNPTQLDTKHPRLSWKIRVQNSKAKGVLQHSYRILVASTPEMLLRNQADLWDSGQMISRQSVLIPYQGRELRSRQTYYWKVQISDNQGHRSNWSDVASWEMALLKPNYWSESQWIGLKPETRDHEFSTRAHHALNEQLSPHPSPLLRKKISISKEVRRARAYVSGIGYSEFYINGNKIGDHVLDPGQTNYQKHTLYVAHDVTHNLKLGENALGIWLGNGFYGQNLAFNAKFGYGQPRVRLKLFIDYADGSSQEFATDTSWKTCVSPVVFDNVYWGETYDARLEIPDWSMPGFDDSDWQPAVQLPPPCPDDRLRPQMLPPIKQIERLTPVDVRKVESDTYLFDFGKNISGWIRLSLNQDEGDVLKIFPAEVLTKDTKRADQVTFGGAPGSPHELYYICKGSGSETWSPRFTYSGFQYAEISGLDKAPHMDDVQAVFVRSDVERTGTFSSSNDLLNRQYEASLLSLEGNWHSLPEDCPHREKCGWLGDAHATADLSLYNYDMARFYLKYLRDIEDSLRVDKRARRIIPNSVGVPTMVAPGHRANRVANIDWGVAYVILPWRLYVHTGDVEAFKPHYDNIKNSIKYYGSFKNELGVIEDGLGDWCPPRWDRKNAPEHMECHPHVSGTAFYYQASQIVSEMARILGDMEYSEWCVDEAKEVLTAFNEVYAKPLEGTKFEHFGSQTATVMALKLGMVAAADSTNKVSGLLYDINELHEGHHSCGIHGLRHLYTVLADHGQDDLAFQMLTDTTFPSPGYVLSCGLSTWPERRFEWKKRRFSNSFNHPMNGGFAAFMHESIGGVRPDEQAAGYKHFYLKPQLTDQLEWVKTSVESPYGKIRSEWRNTGAAFLWDVEVPANTTATIFIPKSPEDEVMEDERKIQENAVPIFAHHRHWLKYEAGSGIYHFTVR